VTEEEEEEAGRHLSIIRFFNDNCGIEQTGVAAILELYSAHSRIESWPITGYSEVSHDLPVFRG
jgi:hypothetical protein